MPYLTLFHSLSSPIAASQRTRYEKPHCTTSRRKTINRKMASISSPRKVPLGARLHRRSHARHPEIEYVVPHAAVPFHRSSCHTGPSVHKHLHQFPRTGKGLALPDLFPIPTELDLPPIPGEGTLSGAPAGEPTHTFRRLSGPPASLSCSVFRHSGLSSEIDGVEAVGARDPNDWAHGRLLASKKAVGFVGLSWRLTRLTGRGEIAWCMECVGVSSILRSSVRLLQSSQDKGLPTRRLLTYLVRKEAMWRLL